MTQQHVCQFCNKSFRRLTTLSVHMCEAKRRHSQKNETWVQLGFMAYLQFLKQNTNVKKNITYDDFASSNYYSGFVRFGSYVQQVQCINVKSYLHWLLKNNKKLDHWCRDSEYERWLIDYLQREAVQDALERSVLSMEELCEGQGIALTDYFRSGKLGSIITHIENGRISPWVIYNCESGIGYLSSLNEEQINHVFKYINPDFWQEKFNNYPNDVVWIKDILKSFGF